MGHDTSLRARGSRKVCVPSGKNRTGGGWFPDTLFQETPVLEKKELHVQMGFGGAASDAPSGVST